MRKATYVIPAAPGAEAGECGVFFFGKGQGGSVDDNLSRWAAQFEGGTPAKKSQATVHGLTVHRMDVSGTYLAPGGPMMQSQGKKPGWRLSGAIVETPEGLVFFKCVGPAKTIEAAEKEIDALIQSVDEGGEDVGRRLLESPRVIPRSARRGTPFVAYDAGHRDRCA